MQGKAMVEKKGSNIKIVGWYNFMFRVCHNSAILLHTFVAWSTMKWITIQERKQKLYILELYTC